MPKPSRPAAPTWITEEDLQRYVEESGGGTARQRGQAKPPPAAACCSSKPQAPPAKSTRMLLRRLGGEWTMKTLTKKLDELAKTDPAEIEWPPSPKPPTLCRGDPLGGAYFAGVVERALRHFFFDKYRLSGMQDTSLSLVPRSCLLAPSGADGVGGAVPACADDAPGGDDDDAQLRSNCR